MTKFVFLSLIFLVWAFYEVSGGADFEPEEPERIAKYKALEAERAAAAAEAERLRKAAIAEKARQREAERAVVQSAAFVLTPPADENVELAALTTQTPLVRRETLFSNPTPTPEGERASIAPDPMAKTEVVEKDEVMEPPADRRKVRANRVNMRGGPGTNYGVLGKLVRGDEVIVLQDPGHGWVELRVVEDGRIGWMSARLLAKVE